MSRASAQPVPAAQSTIRSATERSDRPVVACQALSKTFKDFWLRSRVRAVDKLDLEIYPGEVYGLLGPNGSGKSTTIKLILGLLHKTSGRIAVFGRLPTDVSIKRRIGYLPEESHLYQFLSARETLDYYGKLFGLDHKVRVRRIDELLDMVGLTAAQHRAVNEYSKGMQRRIGIAQALINDPDFLILDEPTSGLDPIGTRQVKDLIIELGRRGKTILLSSHLLSDVEDCVDRISILFGGKKRAEGTPDELLESRSKTIIETDALDEATIAEIDRLVRERSGHAISRVGRPRQRLEDLFLDIVERARQERLETAGAQAGGATAAFLRGDEATEGEALIDRLVEGEPAETPAATPEAQRPEAPAEVDPEARAREEREDIISGLVSGEEEQAAPAAPTSRRERPSEAPPREDVDRSMIDSLLGDDDDEREGERESRG